MMGCAVSEARQRGMDVDMTLGAGWCFGGPEVTPDEANALVVAKKYEVPAGGTFKRKLDKQATQALAAFARDGRCVELTDKIGADGGVEWQAEGGPWTVYAVSQKFSGRKVKRASPGGEGYMLNPFYGKAVGHYLERFTRAFDAYKGPLPRAIYHDSYEYANNWSPDLFKEFEKRRGYRLQTRLPALFSDEAASETVARVKSDYRETISDMMVENFNPPWIEWAHKRGMLARNEAHGSPGNLLDLYAAADSPETEMFHTDRDVFVTKAASSAAHVAGRKFTSSETGTWLAEHFTETLGEVKGLVDELFACGVNHIIYHGCCYSPDEAGWPGWLFYASLEMNPRNSIWRDAPALNQYIARCQAILQGGQPDNDILLYWPIYDQWADPRGMQQDMVVHKGANWIKERPFGEAAEQLWKKGYTFDYISDRQLPGASVKDGRILMPGGNYRVVVVPRCQFMPDITLMALLGMARGGATVIFEGGLPQDVPGLGRLEERRAKFHEWLEAFKSPEGLNPGVGMTSEPKGRVLTGNVEAMLATAGVEREPMADQPGVMFIRRAWAGGRHYFVTNRGEKALDGWVTLAGKPEAAALLDPMTGKAGMGALRKDGRGAAQVYLQLEPGESIILRTFDKRPQGETPKWEYLKAAGEGVAIAGNWKVEFIQGGPALPKGFTTTTLGSWTAAADPEAQRFAGTARYSITFDRPTSTQGERYRIALGKVAQSARVRLNGRELGTVIMPPFQVVAESLKEKGNVLEIEVTNVSANRIRDLDRRGVVWKNFYDTNIVNIDYKPFNAANWPMTDSGLLGPVTVTAAKAMQP
jgi:hypothetical protein